MNGVLGQDAVLQEYTAPGKTWDNELNFGMNHGPGARLIPRPVDL